MFAGGSRHLSLFKIVSHFSEMKRNIVIVSLILLLYDCVDGTLLPKDKPSRSSKSKSKESLPIAEKRGPQPLSVMERQLVRADPRIDEIIANYNTFHEDTDRRYFNGTVLGYVTPWNSHGYDVAKLWAPKFAYISPVWLQIKRNKREDYEVAGLHDVDHAWVKTVKQNAGSMKLKMVPRLLFEGWTPSDYSQLLTGPKEERMALAKTLRKTCKQWKFDGLVIEILSQIPGQVGNDLITDLIKFLGLAMAESLLDFILVLPPSRGQPNDEDLVQQFNAIHPYVTAFSLMTYDFSNPQRPGPNAPFEWIRRCVVNLVPDDDDKELRGKILLGLNFYGNMYTPGGGGPIVGHEFIEFLKNNKGTMKYDDKSLEHFVDAKTSEGRKIVFFPTLFSIQRRIDLAVELGTGIAIWELGQGLDYFYDLF